LEKEIATAKADSDIIERKLASEGFVKKAPPEVVEKERRRLEQLRASIRLAGERLASL
jgi:valyl-tRNA synthetase